MPPKPCRSRRSTRPRRWWNWVRAVRTEEIRRLGGDPGIVLARRLSNAEYDNTIRDLTARIFTSPRQFRSIGQYRRISEFRRDPGRFPGPAEQISAGGAASGRHHDAEARRDRLRALFHAGGHRPRTILRPEHRRVYKAQPPTSPSTSRPPGATATARRSANPARPWLRWRPMPG